MIFVCLGFFISLQNFALIWRRYHHRWRAANFYLDARHSSSRTRDTRTYCRAFISGAVTSYFYYLGLFLDLWSCDIKINRGHLLLGVSTLPSLAIFMQEILSGQHFYQRTSSLTLTFDHVTSKSIGVIFSQGVLKVLTKVSQLSSKEVKRYWADITGSTDTPPDKPTVAKQYDPFFKGGHKNILNRC